MADENALLALYSVFKPICTFRKLGQVNRVYITCYDRKTVSRFSRRLQKWLVVRVANFYHRILKYQNGYALNTKIRLRRCWYSALSGLSEIQDIKVAS
jgi:hypothetical protein